MPRIMLKDEHWTRLKPILLELNIYNKGNLRQTVEGVLYRMRVGCPWRDLPEYFGKPNTIYKAYQRWFRSNKLMALFTLLIKPLQTQTHLTNIFLAIYHARTTNISIKCL